MLTEIRDLGPVLLVPAAWIAAAASIDGVLASEGMLIAHGVMATFIAVFAVTGWTAMSDGALRVWRLVLLVGLPITLAGVAGFFVSSAARPLFSVSLIGWMVLPAAGLACTAGHLPDARLRYLSTAALSAAGAAVAVSGLILDARPTLFIGIAVAGVGQTIGIADASYRDRTSATA